MAINGTGLQVYMVARGLGTDIYHLTTGYDNAKNWKPIGSLDVVKATITGFKIWFLIIPIGMIGCNKNKDSVKPEIRTISESVYASAVVVPKNLYRVYPNASGTIQQIFVEEGDTVGVGQIIASILSDQPEIIAANATLKKELSEANVSSSASAIERINQEISLSREQFRIDSLNHQRQLRLSEKSIGSRSDLELSGLKYQQSKNRLRSLSSQLAEVRRELESALKLSSNELNSALTKLDDYNIRSRIRGKIYAVNCESGELVSSQQVFALIGDRDEFVIELMIDEVDIARVQLNQKVVLSLDAYAGQVFEAVISKIYPTKENRTQTFRLEAIFETKPDNLYNGLSGEANIIISKSESVVTIPLEYLSDRQTVKTKSGKELKIETGRQNMEMVEILSGLDTSVVIVKP